MIPRARLAPKLLRTLLALLACAAAGPVRAQAPHEAWRTLTLPHFRLHYPASSEAWTLRTAARLEAVRERLREEVGYAPPRVVDVVVADPLSRPNGSAWPFLANPRMVLLTTPPDPSSILGRNRDWGELVALHEDVHLVHLLRPSRNPWQRLLGRLVPGGGIGPIALRAPRWVTEGYATLLEGRLTAAGRPNSDLRAAVLRKRALAGSLPGYGALGAGDESWLGRSMAYLAGSAYLEWLVERAGPDALRDLWARMTARHHRGFDDAFEGVFGEGPAALYGRFAAELTWRALEVERRLEGTEGVPTEDRETTVEGELWRDLSWTTGEPAVSPDGSRVAAVVRHREDPPRLEVWETAVDEEAERRFREGRERIAAADPEDVPAVRTAPPFRKTVATLPTFDGRAPAEPRWSPDGESLVFVARGPDADGYQRADLYRWRVDAGEVERLTRNADLRFPEPLPPRSCGGCTAALAVRSRHGLSQLVTVDLAMGAVRPVTEASAAEVWATPRLDPDGRRLAAVRHREGEWRLVVAALLHEAGGALSLGAVRELPAPAGATVADPAWGPDGTTVYAAVGSGGFVDLWAFRVPEPFDAPGVEVPARRLTRGVGAALAPAPTPDGEAVFFLSLEDDGFDIRRLALEDALATGPREPLPAAELAPAVRPEAPPEETFAAGELPPSRPYGAGPQDPTPLVGLALAPSGLAAEAGVRLGDVVGRFDGLLLGSLGTAGALEGGALAAAWRGLPVTLTGHLFAVSEEPSAQDPVPSRAGNSLDRDLYGAYLAAGWNRAFPAGGVAARLGVHGARVERSGPGSVDPPDLDTGAATASAGLAWAPSRGRRSLPLELSLRLQEGETDGERWRRWGGQAGLGLDLGESALRVEYARHGSDDAAYPFDRFQVGGARRSLLPDDVDLARIPVPALLAGTLVGPEHEGQRVELELGFLPAPLFYERHRVWSHDTARGEWLSLAGIELEGALPPNPILGLPAARFTAGVAYVVEEPFPLREDELRAWAALVWRP